MLKEKKTRKITAMKEKNHFFPKVSENFPDK